MKQTINVRLHGATLGLTTDYFPLVAHIRGHFMKNPMILPENVTPDIHVLFDFLHGSMREHESHLFPGSEKLDTIGYRTLVNENRMDWNRIWEFMGLKISFRRDNEKHHIHSVFHELRDDNYLYYIIKRLIRGRYFKLRQQDNLDRLTESLVYYPLCWYLEEKNKMHLMHASAIEIGGKGIVFPGLSGAGKSTLSSYLFSAFNGEFLSDNLLFYDEKKVYSCFEPIRLSAFSRGLLKPGDSRIVVTSKEAVYDRKAVFIDNQSLLPETSPQLLCILRLSRETFIRPISVHSAVAKIMDCNESTGEVKRYFIYASLMNSLSSDRILALERVETLKKLVEKIDCYEVGIKPGPNLKENVDQTIGKLL
jgi:hypothetical protein